MSEPPELPDTYRATRDALHRVAVHVLARRRHQLAGRIGLRATPGGFGALAGGPEHEVLRVSGGTLVRERTGSTASTQVLDLRTASLADAAAHAEVDLDAPLDVGHDTPPVGDVSSALDVDPVAAVALGAWYAFGWRVLDRTLAAVGPGAGPSVVQLWPEHFDAGCDVGSGALGRVNLGVSPGDGASADPYVYVGPWGSDRPGGPGFWNAPFGALRTLGELRASPDPEHAAVSFLLEGVTRLST